MREEVLSRGIGSTEEKVNDFFQYFLQVKLEIPARNHSSNVDVQYILKDSENSAVHQRAQNVFTWSINKTTMKSPTAAKIYGWRGIRSRLLDGKALEALQVLQTKKTDVGREGIQGRMNRKIRLVRMRLKNEIYEGSDTLTL